MKKLRIKQGLLTFVFLGALVLPSFSGELQKGIDLYNTGQFEKAIEILNKIAKAEPKNPEPHLWLAKCYESTLEIEKVFYENKVYKLLKADYEQEQLKKTQASLPPEVKTVESPEVAKGDNGPPININDEKLKEYHTTDNKTPDSEKAGTSPVNSGNAANISDKTASLPAGNNSTVINSGDLTQILSAPATQEFTYFNCIAFSPDSKYIAAGQGYDGEVKIVDLNGKIIKDFKAHDKEVLKIAYSPDGKYLITGGFDQKIKVIDINTTKPLKTIKTPKNVDTLAVNPNGTLIAADGFSNVLIFNIKTGANVSPVKERVPARFMRFNPKYAFLASANGYGNGSLSNEVNIWDTVTGKKLHALKTPAQATMLAFSPDGKYLAANSWQDIIIWNSAGDKIKTIGRKSKETIKALAFSPDGRYLASGARNETSKEQTAAVITLWDTKSFKSVKSFDISVYNVDEIIFSPDGKYLAARGFGGNLIWLWKL